MGKPLLHNARRQLLIVLAFLGQVSVVASNASAVVLYSTGVQNTTAPSTENGFAGWNLQADFGSFLVTPIDSTHFIAAKHISSSSTVTFQGTAYEVDASYRKADPESDLCIYRIKSGTFSNYATLYDAKVDGSEVGKTLTVFGRGRKRGSEVTVAGNVKGWLWGDVSSEKSWGRNVVTRFANYSTDSRDSLLYFTFDRNGIANEAGLSEGDSSGAVFIQCNDTWKLAGINYAIDGPWKYSSADATPFNANIFNAQDLYYKNSSGTWVRYPSADPGGAYASRISDRLEWIHQATIPEPGSVALLVTGGLAAGLVIRRRRSR